MTLQAGLLKLFPPDGPAIHTSSSSSSAGEYRRITTFFILLQTFPDSEAVLYTFTSLNQSLYSRAGSEFSRH